MVLNGKALLGRNEDGSIGEDHHSNLGMRVVGISLGSSGEE